VPKVRLSRVGKVYGGKHVAVRDLDLEIEDGELLVLVGPSGCGKSTVLRMIAGLEEVTSGEIRIGDRVVNDVPPRDRDIAMVFQNYALYPHMTVFDNMAFGLRRRKVPAPDVDRRVRSAAGALDIERYLHRKPRELSGGERQRVALGRALVREPSVFLFDEPLSNLDARLRVQTRAEIKRLHQRVRATMIYVTHDQVEAMTLGDRIAVLRAGVLQQVANPEALYQKPANAFVAGFIGSPPINLVTVGVAGGGSPALEVDGFQVPLPAPVAERLAPLRGQKVLIGIRPEDLAVNTASDVRFTLRGTVEVSEPLGNETLVYWKTSSGTVVSRLTGARPPAVGTPNVLAARFEALHFFDPRNEQAIA
jgi:multiple sugar transport system ATP-binding protein